MGYADIPIPKQIRNPVRPYKRSLQVDLLMEIESACNQWRLLVKGAPDISPLPLARKISRFFIHQAGDNQTPDMRSLDLLCEMALHEDDVSVRQAAVFAIYKDIIEYLCDDFSSWGVELCNRVLLHLITFIRTRVQGAELDALLTMLGFLHPGQLLARYRQLQNREPLTSAGRAKIKKIIFLSRVTVGADVAMTSVLVRRFARSMPAAEIIVFGPRHIPEIFAGPSPRVSWGKFFYRKDGGLAERLAGWTSLYRLLKSERNSRAADQVILVDPDSRLSQLGLLPLFDRPQYCYFPSRIDRPDDSLHLSQLANRWADDILAEEIYLGPEISIRPIYLEKTKKLLRTLPPSVRKIVVNFGVGNDQRKRLPDPFEECLLERLLGDPDVLLILDTGYHLEEKMRADGLMKKMEDLSFRTCSLTEKTMDTIPLPFHHGLVCFQGGIGPLSALIDQADVFFGYDSCCQHLAAARGTRAVICFAGAPNRRFFARWNTSTIAENSITLPVGGSGAMKEEELRRQAEHFARLILGKEEN